MDLAYEMHIVPSGALAITKRKAHCSGFLHLNRLSGGMNSPVTGYKRKNSSEKKVYITISGVIQKQHFHILGTAVYCE